jgi:hypothetical protein
MLRGGGSGLTCSQQVRAESMRICSAFRISKPGAGGGSRTLTGRKALRIFIPTAAFAARARRRPAPACGLWSGLSLHLLPLLSSAAPGLRCCPSSLYTFPAEISVQAWLGIAIAGFPEFGQFCIVGFPASTQVSLSPLRLPFRHARVAVSKCHVRASRGDLHLCHRAGRAQWFRASARPLPMRVRGRVIA